MGANIRDNSHETSSRDHIGIHENTVRRALVDPEYLEPVTGVFCNDPGTDFLILHIVLVQIIKLPQALQFELFRLKTAVLLHQGIDALLKGLFFCHGTVQGTVIADAVVEGGSHPVHPRLDRV